MAASNVSIANRALQILGTSRIESLTQDHPNARTMNTAFEPVRDALMRRYRWNFTKTRASIAADASQTEWGNLNRYTLPADYARLIRDNETGLRVDWRVERGFIVTRDAAPLEFKYHAIVTDPALFDALFCELFSHELALKTCKEVTGNKASDDLHAQRKDALDTAKQGNAYEEDAVEGLEDDWLVAMR